MSRQSHACGRALAASLVFSFAFASPLSATWSICAVDTATGEIAIGSATCLADFDLKANTPVLRVGKGVGVAQSFLGPIQLRQIIWDELGKGTDPAQILLLLEQADPDYETRQYGIVDLQGRAAAHTGNRAGPWAGHVTSTVGTITYSIQGNVLTGPPVVLDAEDALLYTPGDLAEKLMAAMLAARAMGGDGRCSCTQAHPDACGSPPPIFTHSAYVGYMLLTRIGDVDGNNCDSSGCAKGIYYLDLNVPTGNPSLPDPVFRLLDMFDEWRFGLDGLPDHLQSSALFARPTLPADGTTLTEMTIELRDWEGDSLGHGGALVTVEHAPGSDGISSIGGVIDNGDGTYTVPLTAGSIPGLDLFLVVAEVPEQRATLYPYPALPSVWPLVAGAAYISSSNPTPLGLALTEPGPLEQSKYLVMLSASGSSPGFDLGPVHVPLNYDAALLFSVVNANRLPFVNTLGTFDTNGEQSARFEPLPGWLDLLVGFQLTFAFITLEPIDAASNPVAVFIIP
ncbi:MAG: DUF1028 domain-containing protein [Planctomycetota bacterium]